MKTLVKRPRGRPRLGPAMKLFNVNLPAVEVQELDELLARKGLTRSEVIRDLIRGYLRRERRRQGAGANEGAP